MGNIMTRRERHWSQPIGLWRFGDGWIHPLKDRRLFRGTFAAMQLVEGKQ